MNKEAAPPCTDGNDLEGDDSLPQTPSVSLSPSLWGQMGNRPPSRIPGIGPAWRGSHTHTPDSA